MKPLLCLTLLLACSFTANSFAQANISAASKLANANVNFTIAQRALTRTERLFQSGSVSETELRQARHDLDMATIRLAVLKSPDRKEELELLGARAVASNAREKLDLAERLFKSNATSKRNLEMAQFQECMAKLKVNFLENANDHETQSLIAFRMAAAKLKLATSEFQTAERLFKRGGSKMAYKRAKFSLEITRLERDRARKNLGASAGIHKLWSE